MKHSYFILCLCILSCEAKAQPPGDLSKMSASERIRIAEQEQQESAVDGTFLDMMDEAHQLFRQRHYLKAIEKYEDARRRRPYNVYPKVKITDIELSMKDTLALLREAKKTEEVDPNRQKEPDWTPPDRAADEAAEKERQKKQDDWEKNIRRQREQQRNREEMREPAPEVPSGTDVRVVSMEEYQRELALEHPDGLLEEWKDGDKRVWRSIVVRNGLGTEYKRVEHGWGGTFYYRNGKAISETVFKAESYP